MFVNKQDALNLASFALEQLTDQDSIKKLSQTERGLFSMVLKLLSSEDGGVLGVLKSISGSNEKEPATDSIATTLIKSLFNNPPSQRPEPVPSGIFATPLFGMALKWIANTFLGRISSKSLLGQITRALNGITVDDLQAKV